jgi:hypothetical protein
MFRLCIILAGLWLFQPVVEAGSGSRGKLRCYSSKETRDRIARFKLANPLMLLRAAARRYRAQPLRSALCRKGNILAFRFVLLRRDGKVLLRYVNARTGKAIRMGAVKRPQRSVRTPRPKIKKP